MKLKCVNIKKKEHRLVALGDVHLGSKECDVELFKKKIDWIKEQKNLSVILMGDLINCGLRASIGAGSYDDEYNPQEQYEQMLEYLLPIKDKIILVLTGNHENRIYKEAAIDVSKFLARELGATYAGEEVGVVKLKVGNQNYIIACTHGATGGRTMAGKMNGCMRMSEYIDADVYLMGHVHALAHNLQLYRRVNKKNKMIEEQERHYVLTGSFLDWDTSYGEAKGYSPMKKGMPTLSFSGKKFDVQVEM